MRFTFSLAEEKDEPDLRNLLASSPMEGRFRIALQREPDYFLGCSAMGHDWKVLIAREATTGNLSMIGCTALVDRFVNSERCPTGYLGQLRVAGPYQGLMLPARGMAFLREVHINSPAVLWLAAIADQNKTAREIFVLPSGSMFPRLYPAASIHTLGVILRKKASGRSAGTALERGSRDSVKEIADFLRTEGRKKQFYPVYTEHDFFQEELTRGFSPEDFCILRRKGKVIGTAGVWDQSAYKQTIVHGYHGYLRAVKPVYNAAAPLFGLPPLPGKGQTLNAAYLSFICIEDNDLHVFAQILDDQCGYARRKGFDYLMVGLSQEDPLLKVAEARRHFRYRSTLFAFYMGGSGGAQQPALDGRIPYIEIAGL